MPMSMKYMGNIHPYDLLFDFRDCRPFRGTLGGSLEVGQAPFGFQVQAAGGS